MLRPRMALGEIVQALHQMVQRLVAALSPVAIGQQNKRAVRPGLASVFLLEQLVEHVEPHQLALRFIGDPEARVETN